MNVRLRMYYYGYSNLGAIYAKVYDSRVLTHGKPLSLLIRPWQTRIHCCGHIVAHDVSWAAQTGKHLPRTQNVSEQNQTFFVSRTQNLCPQQMLRVRANGETFVSATMCRQQCVLVCQGLY